VERVLDQLPPVDKAEEVCRSLRLVDELLAVYAPKARAGTLSVLGGSRTPRAQGRYLGVDRRKVHVSGGVEHTWTPGPTVDQSWPRSGPPARPASGPS